MTNDGEDDQFQGVVPDNDGNGSRLRRDTMSDFGTRDVLGATSATGKGTTRCDENFPRRTERLSLTSILLPSGRDVPSPMNNF